MDAIFMSSSSAEKSYSPYKQLKYNIPKRNITGANFVSKPSENLAPTCFIHGGGLSFAASPPSFSFSYPPSASLLNPIFYQNHQQLQQPPLLPLPNIPNKPLHSSLPSRTRSLLSSSPSNRKNNRTRSDQSLTPKRSKSKQVTVKVEDQTKRDHLKPTEATKTRQTISKSFVMTSSANPLGPDPNDLPKVLASSYLATGNVAKDLEKFSDFVFTVSPPPSSLPLPKFSLRPKLISCNAEAAGVDAGATDNLRRLLRLR